MHAYIVIGDFGTTARYIDKILEYVREDPKLDERSVRLQYSTSRDGGSRAWVARYAMSELASWAQVELDSAPPEWDEPAEQNEEPPPREKRGSGPRGKPARKARGSL